MKRPQVLFLYTELAQYFLNCCIYLKKAGADVHVVHWPVNKEAPFQFDFGSHISFYPRRNYNGGELFQKVDSINPDIIICSGWLDRTYLKICRKYFKKIPTVLALDNHWVGNLKQKLASLISPFSLLNRFSHCWVPGDLQFEYARKLGFNAKDIYKGFYCADVDSFSSLYFENRDKRLRSFPKRLIYIGRYYDFKGLPLLWECFNEIHNEMPNDWELWCIGTGDLTPVSHPKIKHFGFVQPKDLGKYISEGGAFVLPSIKEPWGVIVHEMSAAGFPLVLSSAVGAAGTFLKHGENGILFNSGNKHSLKAALKSVMQMDKQLLFQMGERSHLLSRIITPEGWAETVIQILNSRNS